MNQILLFSSLFVFGLLFGSLFRRHLPVELLCATAFLWGSLYWVVSALFFLSLSIPYTLANMTLSFGLALILILFSLTRNKLWKITNKESVWMLVSIPTFVLILFAATTWNFSTGTMDSISKIMYGKSLAYDGITSLNQGAFGSMGSFSTIMQSISVLIQEDYIFLVAPSFAYSLLIIFLLLGKRILSPVTKNWLPITLLTFLFLISTYFMRFQIFYIHDNLIAGTYLITSLASYWLSIRENKPYWLIFGSLGLLGFSLARIENPIFSIFFLAIILYTQKVPKKNQLFAFIPFLFLNILWYTRILMTLDAEGRFLKTSNSLITIGALLGFGLYIFLSWKVNWIEENVTPRIDLLMLVSLIFALLFFIIRQPAHTISNISIIARNFYVYGLWGVTSIVITFFLILFPIPDSNNKEDQIFSLSIIVFLLLMILVGGLRNPYRLGWSDSANRMMVHIIPTCFLFLIVKFRNLLESSQLQINELVQTKRFQSAIIGTFILIIALIPLIGYNLLYN